MNFNDEQGDTGVGEPQTDGGNVLPEGQSSLSESNGNMSKTSDKSKRTSERLSQILKKNAKKQSLIRVLAPFLIWGAVIIIGLIVIIGIVLFLITMPGMVMERLKELATSWANGLAAWFGADTIKQVGELDIKETLNYLEDMGYDLKADGFLTEYVGEDDDGVERNDDQSIKKATSEFVKTYLISENYMYTIKNFNMVASNPVTGFLEQLAAFFTGGMSNQYWSRGMIDIWRDTGIIGQTNSSLYYSNKLFNEKIEIDSDNKTLNIKSTSGKNIMTYNLDGWTGRYGMPLEFLVSIHMATKMPDLSYEMATAFETNVYLYLHQIGQKPEWSGGELDITGGDTSSTTTGWYQLPNGNRISYDELYAAAGDSNKITKNNVIKVMQECGIDSPDNCRYYEEVANQSVDQSEGIDNDNIMGVDFDIRYDISDTISDYDKLMNNLKEKQYTGNLPEKVDSTTIDNLMEDVEEVAQDVGDYTYYSPTINGSVYYFANYDINKAKTITQTWESKSDDCKYTITITLMHKKFKGFIDSTDMNNWQLLGYESFNTAYCNDKGVEYDFSKLSYKITKGTTSQQLEELGVSSEEEVKCSNLNPESDKGCSVCIEHVQNILDAVNEVSGGKYDSMYYQPYIAKVTDHWYRDVYFVYDKSRDGELKFVDYDYDYESKFKERWTLYETYGKNSDREGEYKLYTEDGKLYNGTAEDAIAEGKTVTKKAKTILIEDNLEDLKWNEVADNILSAYEANKQTINDFQEVTYEEDDENAGNVYVNIQSSGTVKQTGEGLRTETNPKIKKLFLENYYFRYADADTAEVITAFRNKLNVLDSISNSVSEDIIGECLEDAKKNLDYYIDNNFGEDELYVFVELDENENPKKDNDGHYIYLTVDTTPERNILLGRYGPNISVLENVEKLASLKKKIDNAINDYYVDGDDEKLANVLTEIINAERGGGYLPGDTETIIQSYLNSVNEEMGYSQSNYLYFGPIKGTAYIYENGKIIEKEVDYTKNKNTNENYTINFEGNTYDITEYIASLDGIIDQDALNAFSMLENTHTLDADYIYRDFKELIVELGYFEKEDLTDETPRLLQWLVPDTGSYGFPKRGLDKKEQVPNSTLIHSKGDVDAYQERQVKASGRNNSDNGPSDPDPVDNNDINNSPNQVLHIEDDVTDEPQPTSRAKTSVEVSSSVLDNVVGASAKTTGSGGSFKKDTLIDTATACWQYIVDSGKYSYAGASIPITGGTTVDCSSYVSWILYEYGYEEFGGGQHCTQDFYNTNWQETMGWEEIAVGAGADCSSEIQPGDLFVRDDGNNNGHIQFILSVEPDGTVMTYDCGDAGHWVKANRDGYASDFTKGDSKNRPGKIIRIESVAKPTGEEYKGYNGNEAVVSPVTGILLEYGTYDGKQINSETGEEERTNVDIKYGVQKVQYNDGEEEDSVSVNVETSTDTGRVVSEKVGYAKILVLDEKYYQDLEQKLLPKTTQNWENTFLNTKGKFLDLDDINSDYKLNKDEIKEWSTADKTLYGYKEFAEIYNESGIAGNVILIDGFKCEMPDEEFDENADDEAKPSGKEIKKEDFKVVTVNSFDSKGELTTKEEDIRESLYEKDEEVYMASQKATDKANAEIAIKDEATPSLYIEGGAIKGDFIIIKEGTVIGRTLTDREVAEDYLNEDYEKYRKDPSKDYGEDEDDKDKVMGNYLRISMVHGEKTSQESTSIENVEDYMKLDDGEVDKKNTDIEWEFWYFSPFEGTGWDRGYGWGGDESGPEAVKNNFSHRSTYSGGGWNYDVGIIQWTTNVGFDNISKFCKAAAEYEPSICGDLSQYADKSYTWYDNQANMDKLQASFTKICDNDRDGFTQVQIDLAKWGETGEEGATSGELCAYYGDVVQKYPWLLEKRLVTQGTVMSLSVAQGPGSIPAINSSMSDEEIINLVMEKFPGSLADRKARQTKVALDILEKNYSEEELETWVRTMQPPSGASW